MTSKQRNEEVRAGAVSGREMKRPGRGTMSGREMKRPGRGTVSKQRNRSGQERYPAEKCAACAGRRRQTAGLRGSCLRDSRQSIRRSGRVQERGVTMSISVGADYYVNNMAQSSQTAKASKLQSSLGTLDVANATDEELLESCKAFESYLVEQMLKGMEKTIMKDEDEKENAYLEQFGDLLYEEVSKSISERNELGLAQQLFEAMKCERNAGML